MKSPESTFLTPKEAAELLRVTDRTVRGFIKAGHLRAARIGKLWRINPLDIDRLLHTRTLDNSELAQSKADIQKVGRDRLQLHCAFCNGSGIHAYDRDICPVCSGKGVVLVVGKRPLVTCKFCEGTGVHRFERKPCSACQGCGLQMLAGRLKVVQ